MCEKHSAAGYNHAGELAMLVVSYLNHGCVQALTARRRLLHPSAK